MTLREAETYIKNPVFGDPNCIEAIKILGLVERVKAARRWGNYSQWIPSDDCKEPESLTREDLEWEMSSWFEIGYEEEEKGEAK